MVATAGTTTIEIPLPLRERIAAHRVHPRQPYHEVLSAAMDSLEARDRAPGLDALVMRHRRALRRAAKQHNIARLWLFGSRARGDAGPDSDVDLLYRVAPGAHAWDVAGFYADACDILGVHVDVADVDNLDDDIRRSAMEDAVVI